MTNAATVERLEVDAPSTNFDPYADEVLDDPSVSLEWKDHYRFVVGVLRARLAGPAIPLASRIIAVVDTYDAMTQDRAYRRSTHTTHAIAELLRCCGTQFDPDVVRALQAVLGRH